VKRRKEALDVTKDGLEEITLCVEEQGVSAVDAVPVWGGGLGVCLLYRTHSIENTIYRMRYLCVGVGWVCVYCKYIDLGVFIGGVFIVNT
jgi:hypothetical protein